MAEKKQELEKRLQDVTGQIKNTTPKGIKKGIFIILVCNFSIIVKKTI